MKKIITLSILLLITSCGPLSKYTKYNEYSRVDMKEGVGIKVVMIKNKRADFIHYTLGDFKMPKTNKEFRKYKKESQTPEIKKLDNILVCGFTTEPKYDYYLLLNSKKQFNIDSNYYAVKDTLINKNNVTMIYDKNTPKPDLDLIWHNIYIGSRPKVDYENYFRYYNIGK